MYHSRKKYITCYVYNLCVFIWIGFVRKIEKKCNIAEALHKCDSRMLDIKYETEIHPKCRLISLWSPPLLVVVSERFFFFLASNFTEPKPFPFKACHSVTLPSSCATTILLFRRYSKLWLLPMLNLFWVPLLISDCRTWSCVKFFFYSCMAFLWMELGHKQSRTDSLIWKFHQMKPHEWPCPHEQVAIISLKQASYIKLLQLSLLILTRKRDF